MSERTRIFRDLHGNTPNPGAPNSYREFLRTPAMSMGVYSVPVSGLDEQVPHSEDEIYIVLSGSASIDVGDEVQPVAKGDAIFVRAGDRHQFINVVSDLELLVIFAPAYSGR